MHRNELLQTLDQILQPGGFRDYGPNGLQVEGRAQIRRLVTGVTASRALIEAAIAAGADALLVHHGLFWRGQDGRVTGWMKERLRLLLQHDLNVFAYHLPLDAHPELGNNVQLGLQLGLRVDERTGEQNLLCLGEPAGDVFPSAALFAQHVERVLGHRALLVEPSESHRSVRRVAWCTGGGQGYFEAAIAAGADVYLTGEISEPQVHYARECGVAYIACGHHATERYGVQALGRAVADLHGLEHQYIEIDNPA